MKRAESGAHVVDANQVEVRQELDIRANRYEVVSRLAEDLAHEIKNPLNAIVINLEVLRGRIAAGATDAALERARVLDQEIVRVHVLVDQLLQLVRPPRAESSPISVDDVLNELRPLLELQAKAARARFNMSADSGLFARLARDGLKFAVLNLLTAIYAAEAADESITIETRAVGPDAEIMIRSDAAALHDGNAFVQHARALLLKAGGEVVIRPSATTSAGTTAVLRVPSCSSFA